MSLAGFAFLRAGKSGLPKEGATKQRAHLPDKGGWGV